MAIPAILAAVGRIGASAGVGAAAGEAAGASAGAMSAGRAVASLGQAVGQLGQSARQAHNWIGGLASKLTGELVKGLTMAVDVIGQAAAPIEHLVRVANPAIADRFGIVMRDAYGVIGRMLLPVMESFIGVAQKVGAVMAGLEPVFNPAIDAIAKLVEVIGEEFTKTLKQDAPIFEMLADALKTVAQRASVVVQLVGMLARAFNDVAGTKIARLLGFSGASFDPNASAVGAAARHAQFVQPKAIADEAIKNSLMQGLGQNRAKTLDDIDGRLKDILDWAQRRFGQAEAVKEGFTDAAGNSARDAYAAGLIPGGAGFGLGRFIAARPNR